MSIYSLLTLNKTARRRRAGKNVSASILLNDAIDANSDDDPRLLIQRGIITGNRINFSDAAEKNPNNRAALYFLAIESYERGDLEEAESILSDALKRSLENIPIKALLTLVEFRKERSIKPLSELLSLLDGVTNVVEANALYEMESAIFALNPDDAGAKEKEIVMRGPVGWVLERLDDIAAIIYWFLNHALNLTINMFNKKRRIAWRNTIQGMFYESFGERRMAVELYRKALVGDPLNRDALEALIAYHIDTNDPYKADPYLKRLERQVEEEDKNDLRLQRFRAEILFLGKSFEQASKIYSDLAKAEPLSYHHLYRCGLCHIRVGKGREAVKPFGAALERINPSLLSDRITTLIKLIEDKPEAKPTTASEPGESRQ